MAITNADKMKKIKVEKMNDSNKLIYDCYKDYYKTICSWTKKLEHKYKIDFLIELLETLTDKFQALAVTINDENEAVTIFETLNDRGKDLTIKEKEIIGSDEITLEHIIPETMYPESGWKEFLKKNTINPL